MKVIFNHCFSTLNDINGKWKLEVESVQMLLKRFKIDDRANEPPAELSC